MTAPLAGPLATGNWYHVDAALPDDECLCLVALKIPPNGTYASPAIGTFYNELTGDGTAFWALDDPEGLLDAEEVEWWTKINAPPGVKLPGVFQMGGKTRAYNEKNKRHPDS